MADTVQPTHRRRRLGEYLAVGAIVAVGLALIATATSRPPAAAGVRELVAPMLAMFALTGAVWLLMVLFRNGAVMSGVASIEYFRDYQSQPLDEWIERPARAFNNLMQVPVLFYILALLMMTIPWVDRAQIDLAWIFVAARVLHAVVYIGFNYVPFRFAIYAVSCITLGVMWMRFALSV
jgi:hypothetical protein